MNWLVLLVLKLYWSSDVPALVATPPPVRLARMAWLLTPRLRAWRHICCLLLAFPAPLRSAGHLTACSHSACLSVAAERRVKGHQSMLPQGQLTCLFAG